jgi:hypothetical protein
VPAENLRSKTDPSAGHRSTAPGDSEDLAAGRGGRAHQLEAGIIDAGCAGVADQRHRGALLQALDDAAAALLFIVFVQRHLRRLNAEMLQQHARMACVLRCNQGNTSQYFARALGQIAKIADRSRNHIQAPCRLNHYNLRLH